MSVFVARAFICASVSGLLANAARADSFAYMAASNKDFGILDLSTGAFTLCGNAGVLLAGLGSLPHGVLYGGAYGTSALYAVNPADGSLTLIGNSKVTFGGFGSTAKMLYGLDATATLYRIDPVTAASARVGATGLSLAGTFALSAGSGKLYLQNGVQLYTLSAKTGKAKLIGTGSAQLGALVETSGHLYGGTAFSPLATYMVDPTTGAETQTAPLSGETGSFWGLAPAFKNATGTCPE